MKIEIEGIKPETLREALTHSSRRAEDAGTPTNKRLGFLGDAILYAVVTDELLKMKPEADTEWLHRARLIFKDNIPLNETGRDLFIHKEIERGNSIPDESKVTPAMVSNAMEAIIGGIYRDGGFDKAKGFILKHIMTERRKKEALDLKKLNMKREGEEHKRIRNYVISVIDKRIAGREGLRRLFDDHTGSSDLKLYCQEDDVKIHLSSSDILLLDDTKRLIESIIEIKDQDVTPKNISGILASISMCNKFWDEEGVPYEIKNAQLYVVINDKELSKQGSGKENQMTLIMGRTRINSDTISKYVICSEKNF